MKATKFLFVMFMLLPFVFQGCTSTEEDAVTEKYVEKAQQLAKSYGVIFEVTDPSTITQKTLDDMEEELRRIKKQFKKPLTLKYVIENNNSITFIKSKNSLMVDPLKTRAEVMEGNHGNYHFKVTVDRSESDEKLEAKCEVTQNGVSLTVVVDSETVNNDSNPMTVEMKIRVVINTGGYWHIPYEITGEYDKEEKKGSLTIEQK
jgi:hypothetical protein